MIETGDYHGEKEEIMQHTKNASIHIPQEPPKRSLIRIVGSGIDRPREEFIFLRKHHGTARPRNAYFCFILLFRKKIFY